MGIEVVRAFETSDGDIFKTEQEAKDHEFECAIKEWIAHVDLAIASTPEQILAVIFEDRAKLLPIFKLLNGGNPIILSPRPPVTPAPEDAANGQ